MSPFTRLAMPWLLATLCLSPVVAQDPSRDVTIAFAGPLDDRDAASAAQTLQMAIDEINATQPRGAARLKLITQNDKNDAPTAEHVARYLVKTDAVAVIGHWTSGNSIAVAPIYTEAGMPQLAPIAWSKQFSSMPGNNHFQGVGNNEAAMRYALDYLVPRLNVRKVMTIDDRSILGVEMADAFERYARATGIEVIRQSVSRLTSDFNAPLTLARQTRPELILFTGIGPPTVAIVRSLKRLSVDAALLLSSPVTDSDFLDKCGHTDEAVYAIAPGIPIDTTGKAGGFRKRYTELFQREPSSSAGNVYDAIYTLAAAIRKAGVPDRQRIVAALHEISYSGINQTIAFNADGSLKNPVYTLYEANRGRWLVRKQVKDPG